MSENLKRKPEGAAIGWRDYERGNDDVKKAEVFKIPLERIHIKDGFNPRDINKPETQEKINNIKAAYKAGEYVKPIEVYLNGTEAEVVDGHCRLTAARLAKAELLAEGMEDALPHLICVPFKGNDLDRLAHTVHGNEGEKLTPMECAEVVRRMQGLGLVREKIAERLRFSIGWVDRLIVLNKLPEAVKQRIRDGKVTPEVAVMVFKAEGEDGVLEALDKKVEEAGGKVTAKHVKGDGDSDKEAKRALKLEAKERLENRLRMTQIVAFNLPKKLVAGRIKDEELYDVQLSGSALKALKKLQEEFAEENAALEKEGKDPGSWPFKPTGQGASAEAQVG